MIQPNNNETIAALTQRIDDIERELQRQIRTHQHDGLNSTRTGLDQIQGMFQVVATAPTNVPRDAYDQVQLYVNGTTYRLYAYDWQAHAWHYANLT